MKAEELIEEAWQLYDIPSRIGACSLARVALERSVNRLAQPKRRAPWLVAQISRDLRRDGTIRAGLDSRLRCVYFGLSEAIHGCTISHGDVAALITKVSEVCAELEPLHPNYRAWRQSARRKSAVA